MVSYICRLCMLRSEAKAKYASIASYSHWLIVLGDILSLYDSNLHASKMIEQRVSWKCSGFAYLARLPWKHCRVVGSRMLTYSYTGCWLNTWGGNYVSLYARHGARQHVMRELKSPPCFWPTSEFWTIESSPRVCFTLFVVGSRHDKSNCQQLQTGPDQLIYPSQPAFAVDTISKRNIVMGGVTEVYKQLCIFYQNGSDCTINLCLLGVGWYVGTCALLVFFQTMVVWYVGAMVGIIPMVWLVWLVWLVWYCMVGMCRSVYAQQRIGVGQWLVSGAGDAGVTTTVRETTRINQATKKKQRKLKWTQVWQHQQGRETDDTDKEKTSNNQSNNINNNRSRKKTPMRRNTSVMKTN